MCLGSARAFICSRACLVYAAVGCMLTGGGPVEAAPVSALMRARRGCQALMPFTMVGISKALALAASVASVQAFVRPAPLAQQSAVARRAGRIEMQTLDGMIGSSAPFKNFDPLGFARKANAATLAKYRESELKHGRVAMLATVGWFFQEKFHPLYDGKLSANPLEAAKQVPVLGWVQILLAIHIIEYVSAQISKLPGARPGDYLGTWEWVEKSDEGWDTYQTKELNNGRLAMMAISGLIVQDLLTGQAGHEQIASTFFK